jgi:hypothetical protein
MVFAAFIRRQCFRQHFGDRSHETKNRGDSHSDDGLRRTAEGENRHEAVKARSR